MEPYLDSTMPKRKNTDFMDKRTGGFRNFKPGEFSASLSDQLSLGSAIITNEKTQIRSRHIFYDSPLVRTWNRPSGTVHLEYGFERKGSIFGLGGGAKIERESSCSCWQSTLGVGACSDKIFHSRRNKIGDPITVTLNSKLCVMLDAILPLLWLATRLVKPNRLFISKTLWRILLLLHL